MKFTGKLYAAFTFVLAFYTTFAAGVAFNAKHWSDFGYFLLLAIFWAALSFAGLYIDHRNAKLSEELEESKLKFEKQLDDLLEHIVDNDSSEEKKLAAELHRLVHEIAPDAGEGNPPTLEQITNIEERFYERTGQFVRLTPEEHGLDATISKIALAPRDTETVGPLAAKAATKVLVTDEDAKVAKRREAGRKAAATRKAKAAKKS